MTLGVDAGSPKAAILLDHKTIPNPSRSEIYKTPNDSELWVEGDVVNVGEDKAARITHHYLNTHSVATSTRNKPVRNDTIPVP